MLTATTANAPASSGNFDRYPGILVQRRPPTVKPEGIIPHRQQQLRHFEQLRSFGSLYLLIAADFVGAEAHTVTAERTR